MASRTANNYKELLALKIIDFENDAFNIILMQPGFTFNPITHEIYTNVSAHELPTAYGYIAGGQALAGVSVINDPILSVTTISWNNVPWTAVGGDLEACGAIIYDDTVALPDNKPIIGFIDFGSTLITYNGGAFTVANVAVSHT